ncbi:hypothetical protein NGM10_07465 [Halorussus salilacus]|uniref:hypothetical protein n=1 Tax=Halorussus salilacus TaxID=2953750 RepID=UPI0020A20E30|nr:hypothetical protein [Halorussus salilacus]USZ69561.1 hypothetical protein NGM10_07465 [Halorussus salilacus]
MTGFEDSEDSINRRTVLRTAGAGLAGAGVFSGAVSGRSGRDREAIIEQSHDVLQATGSVERQHEFLRNRGFNTTYDRVTYQIPTSGEVGTESFDKADLDITLSLFIDCSGDGTYTAQQSWTYDWGSFDGGADPMDISGLGWTDGWDLESYTISETTYSSEYVSYHDGSVSEGPGIAFDVDDYGIMLDDEEDYNHFFAVDLETVGDYTEEERRIQGSYTHLWESIEITGISIGYPASVSVSVSDATYKWKTDTEDDGDTLLRVNESQASASNCW